MKKNRPTTTQQEAAQSLAQQAVESERQSVSNMLIDSALSLDSSIDGSKLRAAWLEKWLKQNQNRTGNE